MPLIVSITLVPPVSADYEPTDHLVVSEVSPTSSPGEWVEIYNPTNQDISLNGCWVDGYGSTRDYYFSSTDVIKAHGYFLAPNVWLTDDGVNSWAILRGPSGTIDGVGWGSGTNWTEGSAAPAPGYDHSLERKSGPTHEEGMGNGYDTNNNANDFFVCDSPNPQGKDSPIEPPFVLVSISPDENGGLPETVVTFTVAVKNDRPFEDNFDLEASGFWDSVLDDSWLSIGAGETENTTLRVTIPTGAGPGMNDIITVTATSRIMEDTNSDSCIVTAYAPLGVKVSISPSSQTGMPGLDQSYSVEVRNFGITTDNYALTVSDELGWVLSLGDNLFTLDPDERDNTSLQVSIPENTLGGVEDIITVIATSQTDNTVSGSDTCTHVCVYEPLKYWARPTDDTTVDQKYPNTPQGEDPEKLCVGQHYSTSDLERSLLKFDISLIPQGAWIENARLKLYHHYGTFDGGPAITVELREVQNDGWSEDVTTWNNQPAMGDLLYSEVIHDYMDGMWLNHPDGVDVKSYIGNELADGYASFGLTSPDAAGTYQDVEFSSKETTYGEHQKPYLEVWYYPCPLPPVGVDVGIDRGPQAGWLGERLEYPVTITNLGTGDDNFDLTVSDTEGWGLELSEDLLIDVSPDENRAVMLTVTIPMDAEPGTIDSITVTATSQENEIVSDNAEAIAAAPEAWVAVSNSPTIKAYGVGVVGAGENIYIINSDTYQSRIFMRYNTVADEWKYLAAPQDNLKNAVAMAWDSGNYIYVLNGAMYGQDAFFFYRYDIGGDSWARLSDTPHTQGAGDAMCWVPGSALGVSDDNYLYAIVGKDSGSKFYRYSVKNSSWSSELNLLWGATDDGCSLVWTGSSYLYALRGEWEETSPCYDFARYDLTTDSWTSKAPIPADPHDGGSGGVGDGGSLLWIGGDYGDYIYALSGNQAVPEPIYDKRFYRYTISANSWERLADLPAGIGNKNGPRLGFASGSTGKIYCWRGCKGDPVLWMYCPMGSVGRGIGVVLEGFNSAYNVDHGGLAPWVWYENTPENAPNPPVMVAGGVGDGTVTAAGIAASCEGSDWQGYTPDNLDVLLDETFKVMAGGTTKKFEPVADAEVTEGNPDSPDSPDYIYNLYNGWNSTYLSQRDYFRLDLSEIPLGSTIDSAVLWLNSKYGPSTGEDPYPPTWHLVDAENVSDDSWDESTLTWNTAPPMGPTILDTENFQADDYVGEYKWYSWDVTSYVAGEFANDDQVVSMGLKRRDEGASDSAGWFYSKDNTSYEPYLRVRWTGQVQNVLWYEGYGAYYTSSRCSALIEALENLGWIVENTDTEPITPSLLEGYAILVIPQLRLGDGSLGGDPGLLPDADVQAIKGFVENGGGLLIMERSDSNDNNYCMVQNKILDALDFGWYFQHDEVQDAENTPGENHEPWLDVIGYHPIGGAYETATGNDNMQLHAACSLIHLELGVEVSISPETQGDVSGETLIYTVTVRNTGNVPDNYSLENSDNAGWVLSLDNDFLVVPVGENRTTTLRVTVPHGVEAGEEDKITVTATSRTGLTVSSSDSCTAQVLPFRDVEVSISPDNQENVPTGTLDYTVTVTNTGNAADTYDLTVSDNENWGPSIAASITVPTGENRTTALTVTIPENAELGTKDNITVTATSQADNTVENSASCLAHAVQPSFEVSISPGYQENLPGCKLEYTVIVKNTSPGLDTYALKASDDQDWTLEFADNLPTVPPSENTTVILTVWIPANAVPCTEDNITITATSQADNTVEHSASCLAHAARPSFEVSISPGYQENLPGGKLEYTVIVKNTSPGLDTYALKASDDQDWTLELADNLLTVPPENTKLEFLPLADTYFDGGTSTSLTVKMIADATLLKFDVSSIDSPIENVALKLYCYVIHYNGAVVDIWGVEDDWEENVAWNGRPAAETGVLVEDVVEDIPSWWTFQSALLTEYVESQRQGDGIVSLALDYGGGDLYEFASGWNHGQSYYSKEADESHPHLEIFLPSETTLTVAIPENAVICTEDNITVTATSQADNTIENSASCIAHAVPIIRSVEVSISPENQENLPGGTLEYTVTVTNTGTVPDTYDLTPSDTKNWDPTLGVGSLTVPPFGENRTTTLTVNIPENAVPCTEDNITVTATSQTDNTVENSTSCIAHVLIAREVEVSISPDYQENVPSGTLEYTVTVTNTGNVPDNYDLSASDTESWGPSIVASITVPADENRTTTLTVTIPENAVHYTLDNITVTATSQTDNTVDNSASCTAHAIVRGVEVSILPDYQENLPTGTLDYEVTVTNTGNVPDNYDLTAGDNEGWGPTLGVGSLTVPPFGENRTTTLTVTIPENATGCTRDNITVTATSQANPSVSDNASCIAHAVHPSVEVSISPISQENVPGGKLEYTVVVKNISLALDSYALEASGDQDWTLELADDLLTVPPGENTKVEFLPLADTYVDGLDSPDTPQGESTGLEVTKTADATLLKFDVSSICSPIKNVALKLYCYEICQFSSKEVDIWGVEDGWEENVTWNSGRPAAETGVLVEDVLEDIPSWWTFQSALLTEYVENQRQGDGIVSLALDFGGADLYASASSFHYGQRYYSKEADGNHPYLEILLPGETTLTVTIPDNATGCTRDNITVTATSQADNTTENSASCIAHAIPIVRGVEVIVEPDGQSGVIGENVVFTVTVRNTGEIWENYQLENNDDAGWALKLDNDYLEIPENESRETKLTVFVPDNENLVCTTDNIIVIATAVNNAEVTDNDNATVHAVWLLWSGTAAFELENLYAVRVDKDLQLYTGSKLVVKFYTYGDGYENESVIETFTTPPSWHVEENELARHPEGIGVRKARLVLTTDDTGNELLPTIASFVVTKVMLETRFMDIPFEWSQADPAGKVDLETEFMEIPFYWSGAPD